MAIARIGAGREYRRRELYSAMRPSGSKVLDCCGLSDRGVCQRLVEVLQQDEGVHRAAVKQEPKDVSIELPAFAPHPVVPPDLI